MFSGRGYEDDYDEFNSEEEDLRKSAIKTLDLRGRIDGRTIVDRRVLETDEALEDEEDSGVTRKEKMHQREQKIQKLLKKQEMEKLLYKAEKKAKKKEKARLKSQVSAVLSNVSLKQSRRSNDDLPSASDYSDLESPNEGNEFYSIYRVSQKKW